MINISERPNTVIQQGKQILMRRLFQQESKRKNSVLSEPASFTQAVGSFEQSKASSTVIHGDGNQWQRRMETNGRGGLTKVKR